MANRIDQIIASVIAVEKGYVNNPNDKGGETNFGITVAVARANGYTGPMKDMPQSFAEQVYRTRYIIAPAFDKIVAIHQHIGEELIDTGVNMGPATASTMLQEWLNGFNLPGSGYQDLFVDGRLGPLTFEALGAFLKKRKEEGARVLYTALNSSQAARYLALTKSDKSQRQFLYGWMSQRVAPSNYV